jgi:ribosomal protein L23
MKAGSPVIRPSQRKPYVRGTRAQIAERVQAVAELLAQGAHKTEIHRAVRARFDIEWRMCDVYIARAGFVRTERQTGTDRGP